MEAEEIREYYCTTYMGGEIPPGDFPRLFKRAEDTLQTLTMHKLYTVPENHMDHVKKALCMQIEYLYLQGVESATVGVSGGGFTTGHVSVSAPSGGSGPFDGLGVCQQAYQALFPTGLLYRGAVLC